MAKTKTLYDFFISPKSKLSSPSAENKKSPKSAQNNSKISSDKKKAASSETSETPKTKKLSTGKRAFSADHSPENDDKNYENGESSSKKKRRRLIIASDSDSENEYKPDKMSENEEEDSDTGLSSAIDSEEEKEIKPKKRAKATKSTSEKKSKNSGKTSSKPGATPKLNGSLNLSIFESPKTPSSNESKEREAANTPISESQEEKEWTHLSLDWLKDDKIRDKKGRPKSHPDYDPRTLFVSEAFKKNSTPAMRQWWEMKSDHFDTVLFFKVGKFYELYHMDAVITVEELGLIYMKGDFAHSGFPEISYGRFADRLVQKGYKVARVEQTETPLMMEDRVRQLSKPTKFDKVVTREICQITTKGTRIFTCQDGEPMAANNSYLIALTEKPSGECTWGETEYGICFIDTSVGKFHIGQFPDDRHRSRLRTLTAHHPPSEIIYERDAVSKKTQQIFAGSLNNVKATPIGASSKYWDAAKTLKYLMEKNYFSDSSSTEREVIWPEPIKEMLDEEDRLNETPKREYELAMRAFAAVVCYLKECLIDDQLLTMRLFERYIPLDDGPAVNVKSFHRQYMVLDGVTLSNLEILDTVDSEGTLVDTIDFTSTNFGKRLLHRWLCAPLCDPKSINDRLDAVEDLASISHVIDDIVPSLRKLPDLERLLSRIHAQGLARPKDHPDSRAIFYEEETYSKRKIIDFLSTIEGFKCCNDVISQLDPFVMNFKSNVLKQTVSFEKDKGFYPDVKVNLDYFDSAFDHELAKKNGRIIPSKDVDTEYDSAVAEVEEILEKFEEYLQKQKKKFQCKLSYFGSGRNRYQIEVPDHAAADAGSKYELQSQRKGFKRFYTAEIKDMLACLTSAEEIRDTALLDIMRRIFEKFDQSHAQWKSIVQCIATLDVLISLMVYKKSSPVAMCRPEIVMPDENTKPFLKIVDGRHPSLMKSFTGDNYIPNSVYLGPVQKTQEKSINQGGNVVLVTGPNMGGKSTLMRQTGLLIVLAQLGSYVPAEKCQFTPVDRVFTRLGASDRINVGESTFFVEVSEMACILQHATVDSLVLIDELGRGTSTFDGTAIACAVVQELANRVNCRTLFSTHYHSLVEDFVDYPNVGLGHMACMVDEDDNHPALERITFLYKFMDGICPKSYGFNVAHLAGIPEEIVQRAYRKAKELEKVSK